MVHHFQVDSSQALDMPTPLIDQLVAFRRDLYGTFTCWPDALFELTDACLCANGPVHSLPQLSLEPEFSRSHGSLYKALERGRIDEDRLRSLLVANLPASWPLIFAVDASTWARCDAECSPRPPVGDEKVLVRA